MGDVAGGEERRLGKRTAHADQILGLLWRHIGPGHRLSVGRVRRQQELLPGRVEVAVVPKRVFVDHCAGRRVGRHVVRPALAHDPYPTPVAQGFAVIGAGSHSQSARTANLPRRGLRSAAENATRLQRPQKTAHRGRQGNGGSVDVRNRIGTGKPAARQSADPRRGALHPDPDLRRLRHQLDRLVGTVADPRLASAAAGIHHGVFVVEHRHHDRRSVGRADRRPFWPPAAADFEPCDFRPRVTVERVCRLACDD